MLSVFFGAIASQSVCCRRTVAAVAAVVVLTLGVLMGLAGLFAVHVDAQSPPTNSEVPGYGMTDLALSASAATGFKGATVPSDQMQVVARLTQVDASAATIVAQGEDEADPQETPEQRVVETSSSTRIDGVVISLYAIAGVMTVMLGLFIWHTSPRRRLRLSRERYKVTGSAQDGVRPADRAEPDNPGSVESGDDMV